MNKLIITLGIVICTSMIGACSTDDTKVNGEKKKNEVVILNVSAAQATNITPATSGAASTNNEIPQKDRNNKMAPPNAIPGR